MMKYIMSIVFVCTVLSCGYDKGEDVYSLIIYEELTTNPFFYPINNLSYMDNVYSIAIRDECTINIDSLVKQWSFQDQYGNETISDYKKRSIYINTIARCSEDSKIDLSYKIVPLSNWATGILLNTYEFIEVGNVQHPTSKLTGIKGLNYNFVPLSLSGDEPSPKHNDCIEFINLSEIHRSGKFYAVEIITGCAGYGGTQRLYLVTENFGKLIIENVYTNSTKF